MHQKVFLALTVVASVGLCYTLQGTFKGVSAYMKFRTKLIFSDVSSLSGHLKEELKKTLRKKLIAWSSSLDAGHRDVYINLPITEVDPGKESKRLSASNVDDILQQTSRSGLTVICGEAGTGKTTVLHHIAQCWLDIQSKMDLEHPSWLRKYDYVFLIPLRMARSHTIVDIICKDLKLVSEDFTDTLQRELEDSHSCVLFLLDSFEELHHKTPDINRLINIEDSNKCVVVTSRPGSELDVVIEDATPHIKVQLNDLNEENVKSYIEKYSSTTGKSEGQFPLVAEKLGIKFLKRPINLSLVCYLYMATGTTNIGQKQMTQTKLFNEMLKHILHEYLKKRHKKDIVFEPLALLDCQDRELGSATAMFQTICQMCYVALREKRQWLNTPNIAALMDFGLFTQGPDVDSVVLPHLLFLEYFAALHLVANQAALAEHLGELRRQRESAPVTQCLSDIVTPLGLENVIKFVVGLSPQVGRELCRLFVIKQQHMWNDFHQSVYSYELELLQECTDNSVKSVMAEALLNAPLITVSGRHFHVINNSGAEQLLNLFSVVQSRQFLSRAYDCVEMNLADQKTMCRYNTETGKSYICDSYVVSYLQQLHCTAVKMGKTMAVTNTELPVDSLPLLISGVSEELFIHDCTVRGGESGEHLRKLQQSTPTLPKITLEGCKEVPVDALLLLMSGVSEELVIVNCTVPGAESGEHIHGLLQSTPTRYLR